MKNITGTYRLVSCDNLRANVKAYYNNMISEADLDLLATPANEAKFCVVESADGISFEFTNSKQPEKAIRSSYKYGEEKKYEEVPDGVYVSVRSENKITETVTFPGNVYTWTTYINNLGFETKVTSTADGYIATSMWEKIDPSICGLFVMESHVDYDKALTAEFGMAQELVSDALKYTATKLVCLGNNKYAMTDFLGDSENTVVFTMGEEFQDENQMLNLSSSTLVTKPAPGQLLASYKDNNTGKTSVWRGEFTDERVTWSLEKAANGVPCSITYRRIGDLTGSWKLLNTTNMEAYLLAAQTPADMIADLVAERSTVHYKQMGKGVWKYTSDSKIGVENGVLWRDCEEVCYEMMGATVNEVAMFHKKGMMGSSKMSGQITKYNLNVGAAYMTLDLEVENAPQSKAQLIYAKI